MTKTIGLKEYWDLLNRHDWYYQYSDDHSVWQRGENDASELASIANQSEEHAKLHKEFTMHYFSGDAWKTVKHAKPERPT